LDVIIQLLRVKHYIKNFLIFLPIVFAVKILDKQYLKNVFIGLIIFSFLASVIYIINDIADIENDRQHEIKKNRPIASGKVNKKTAIIIAILLFFSALLLQFIFLNSLLSWLYLGLYFIINIAYNFGLKNIPLVDIIIIVTGYLLRVLYGGAICSLPISNWMYLTIMSLSFFMAFGKRRNEMKKSQHHIRKVLKHYTISFLDKSLYLCLALTIVFYSLWTVSDNFNIGKSSVFLIWTVPLALLICLRYCMNIEGDSHGDPADVLLDDKVLRALVSLYILIMALIIFSKFIFVG